MALCWVCRMVRDARADADCCAAMMAVCHCCAAMKDVVATLPVD